MVGVWLVCQIASLVLVSATPWVPSPAAAGLACTCPHDADGACPMHKKDASSTPCLLRGPNDSRAALGSLFGPVGLLSAPTTPTLPVFIGTMSLVDLSSVTGSRSASRPAPASLLIVLSESCSGVPPLIR